MKAICLTYWGVPFPSRSGPCTNINMDGIVTIPESDFFVMLWKQINASIVSILAKGSDADTSKLFLINRTVLFGRQMDLKSVIYLRSHPCTNTPWMFRGFTFSDPVHHWKLPNGNKTPVLLEISREGTLHIHCHDDCKLHLFLLIQTYCRPTWKKLCWGCASKMGWVCVEVVDHLARKNKTAIKVFL